MLCFSVQSLLQAYMYKSFLYYILSKVLYSLYHRHLIQISQSTVKQQLLHLKAYTMEPGFKCLCYLYLAFPVRIARRLTVLTRPLRKMWPSFAFLGSRPHSWLWPPLSIPSAGGGRQACSSHDCFFVTRGVCMDPCARVSTASAALLMLLPRLS